MASAAEAAPQESLEAEATAGETAAMVAVPAADSENLAARAEATVAAAQRLLAEAAATEMVAEAALG